MLADSKHMWKLLRMTFCAELSDYLTLLTANVFVLCL